MNDLGKINRLPLPPLLGFFVYMTKTIKTFIQQIFRTYKLISCQLRGITVGKHTEIKGTIDIRAKGGEVVIGNDCLISGYMALETPESNIIIGDNVFIGSETIIDCACRVEICDDVLISYQVIIQDSDNHSTRCSFRKNDNKDWKDRHHHNWEITATKPVKIAKGAWLGSRAIILKGVTIGEGSVVGAGSVVTRDVPPWTIVAGNPAKVIREILEHER